jgi:FeS assembly SUF system protein
MGLGDMLAKLFKKENGKETKVSEPSERTEPDTSVENLKAVENPRTENIYKLEASNIIEEVDNRLTESKSAKEAHQETKTSESTPSAELVTEERVLEVLSDIYDPEIPIDIVNLGLIYGIDIQDGRVYIKMTMTAPGCPSSAQLAAEAKMLVEEIPGVKEAIVEVVWDPPWDPSRMSEEAKMSLGYF